MLVFLILAGLSMLLLIIAAIAAGKTPGYSRHVSYGKDISNMMVRVDGFLESQGYSSYSYKKEDVYRKRKDLFTMMFIKVIPGKDGFLVEGFFSIFGIESGLIAISKKLCRDVVFEVIDIITEG